MRIADLAMLTALGTAMAWSVPAQAQIAGCPLAKSDAADVAVGNIKTWHSFAQYRRDYAVCDDGGTAEGSSAAVVRMLATNWRSLPALQHEMNGDPALGSFLYRHINSTVDGPELEAIQQHARTQCPSSERTLCREIGKAAARALAELR